MTTVYLVDGTYELFRYHFGQPSHRAHDGVEVGATRGVLASMVSLLEAGCTHLGVATDHVIESFRNDLYDGYKTGSDIEVDLMSQFPLFERSLRSLGFVVWPMVDYEADDALASACSLAERDHNVSQVIICSPDKDLGQCVSGTRVIQRIRRTGTDLDEEAINERFGIAPKSIPDWLALVGDSADGFPGIKGWGKKSASVVLAHYPHLEEIPRSLDLWADEVRSRIRMVESLHARLFENMDRALLFRDLATLRTDFVAFADIEELRWRGVNDDFEATCDYLGVTGLVQRIRRLSLTS